MTLRSLAFIKARFEYPLPLLSAKVDLGVIDEDRRLSLEKQLSTRGAAKGTS